MVHKIPRSMLLICIISISFLIPLHSSYATGDDFFKPKEFPKIHFSTQEFVGESIFSLHFCDFTCLCGKRFDHKTASFRKIEIHRPEQLIQKCITKETEHEYLVRITTNTVDKGTLPKLKWKLKQRIRLQDYTEDSLIRLPWSKIETGNENDTHYIIMHCPDPECDAVLKAYTKWHKEIVRQEMTFLEDIIRRNEINSLTYEEILRGTRAAYAAFLAKQPWD